MFTEGDDTVPSNPGEVSIALRLRLIQEDLLDLEILLRKSGLRTLGSLLALDVNSKSSLLWKARKLWLLFGMLPEALNSSMSRLFHEVSEGSSSSQSWATPLRPARPGQVVPRSGQAVAVLSQNGNQAIPWLELPVPEKDDSAITQALPDSLNKVRTILGVDRYNEVVRLLTSSSQQAVSSVLEATEALVLLNLEEKVGAPEKILLKEVRKTVRDVILWRCFGSCSGFDSTESLVRTFEECCQHAGLDKDYFISQFKNGLRRTKEDLGIIPQSAKSQAASAPPRQAATIQAAQATPTAVTHVRSTAAQATPTAVPLPPGLQLPKPQPELKQQPELEPTWAPAARTQAAAQPKDTPPAEADLAAWLGKAISTWKTLFGGECLTSMKGALLRTLQRVRDDSSHRRLVLETLAMVTGVDFLHLPFLEMALNDTDNGLDEQLMHAVADAWAWLLSNLQTNKTFELYYAEDRPRAGFEHVLELTLALPDYFTTFALKKDVSSLCCNALGSLTVLFHDSLDSEVVTRIFEWIIGSVNLFMQHPDFVHKGLASLVAIKQHSEIIFGINVTQTHRGTACSHDAFTSPLGQMRLQEVVRRCEAQSDIISEETVTRAYKLVVHSCPFLDVLRCILSSKCTQRDLLLAVLDDIESSLTPALTEWLQVAGSRRLQDCTGIEVASFVPPEILTQIKAAGGVGIDALRLLEQTLQKPAGPMPKLPFLFEWAMVSSCQSRLFLLGILFSPSLLIARLPVLTNNQSFFANVLESLLDLNSLEGFDRQSQRKLAETLIDLVPQTPHGCVTWVQCLQIFLLVPNDSADQDLIQSATDELISAVRWAVGRQGWSRFIFQAFSFATQRLQQKGLMHPQTEASLKELASLVQKSVEDEVQANMQVQFLLSSFK